MDDKILCLSCKFENIPDTMFCTHCGAIMKLDLKNEIDCYALRVFRLAGYCAPDVPIPNDVFSTAFGMSPESPRKNGVVDQAIVRLNELGVAGLDQNCLSFNSVSLTAARKLDETVQKTVLLFLASALADLAFDANRLNATEDCALYRPHLKVAVRWAEEARMERAVALWGCLGECHFLSKEYPDAKMAYAQALELSNGILGENHARSAVCMCNLAKAYRALEDEDRAIKLDEEARRILEISLGKNDPHTASALNDLGSIFHKKGDLDKAKEYLNSAVEIYLENNPDSNPLLAIASFNLGEVLKDSGDLDGALVQYRRALQIDEPLFGPEHKKVVIVKQRINELSNGGKVD